MPRENTTHNKPSTLVMSADPSEPNSGEPNEQAQRDIHVGWDVEGGWVQLSVELSTAELTTIANTTTDERVHIWSETLTGDQIASLIYHLKRAHRRTMRIN